jgi:hypothetical protein
MVLARIVLIAVDLDSAWERLVEIVEAGLHFSIRKTIIPKKEVSKRVLFHILPQPMIQ